MKYRARFKITATEIAEAAETILGSKDRPDSKSIEILHRTRI